MEESKISSGSKLIDEMMNGGYEKEIVTTIYGPAGSGKTLLCQLAAISVAREKKKVIYVDTEGSFSMERFKQIVPDYQKVLENILFFRPTSFEEQKGVFEKLRNVINDKIGLIIVDTISMLYRLEIGQTPDVYQINRDLGIQISYLSEIARKMNIPVLITTQVYANFEEREGIKIVGGDLLKYGSKCLIELQVLRNGNRVAILRKHRSLPESKQVIFAIINEGIIPVKL